jgi:hypothetical protein
MNHQFARVSHFTSLSYPHCGAVHLSVIIAVPACGARPDAPGKRGRLNDIECFADEYPVKFLVHDPSSQLAGPSPSC